jgi:hypothetical protein
MHKPARGHRGPRGPALAGPVHPPAQSEILMALLKGACTESRTGRGAAATRASACSGSGRARQCWRCGISQPGSPLTCSSLPRSRAAQAVRTRDVSATTPAELRQPARVGPARAPIGRSPGQPATHIPADLDRNRKGAPSHPRGNGQAFDEARNPINVAGCRRCRASVPAHPCWDQAFPCCSPLTGWAPGPVAASRPSGPVASSLPSEDGKAPLGSTHWQNYFPAPSGSGWDDETPPCRVHWRAHDGALAASPRLCLRPKAAGTTSPA